MSKTKADLQSEIDALEAAIEKATDELRDTNDAYQTLLQESRRYARERDSAETTVRRLELEIEKLNAVINTVQATNRDTLEMMPRVVQGAMQPMGQALADAILRLSQDAAGSARSLGSMIERESAENHRRALKQMAEGSVAVPG